MQTHVRTYTSEKQLAARHACKSLQALAATIKKRRYHVHDYSGLIWCMKDEGMSVKIREVTRMCCLR
jgi:hypothetical protein